MIYFVSFRQPRRIQTNNCDANVAYRNTGHVSKPITGQFSILANEISALEVSVILLPLQQCLDVVARRKKLVDMVLALNIIAGTLKAHFLAVPFNVMVSRDRKYPVFRHTGCSADRVEKACDKLVFVSVTRKGEIPRRQYEVRQNPFLSLLDNAFTQRFQDYVKRPCITFPHVKVRNMKPGDRMHV